MCLNFIIKISKKFKFLSVSALFLAVSLFSLNSILLSYKYNGEPLWSDSIYIVNNETGRVIFEKNAEKKRPIASINKIMTFIVVYKNCKNLEEKVKISQNSLDKLALDGSFCGLKANEEYTVNQLLHGLMMSSGNDCGQVMTDFLNDKLKINFIEEMNKTAKKLGCMNTHFTSSHGNDEESFSTAKDVTRFMSYALKIPLFKGIIGKKFFNMFPEGDARNPITCKMKIMQPEEKEFYFPYVKGGKTGSKTEAGRCFTSYAEKDNISYVLTTLGAPIKSKGEGKYFKWVSPAYSFYDAKNLYEWAFSIDFIDR